MPTPCYISLKGGNLQAFDHRRRPDVGRLYSEMWAWKATMMRCLYSNLIHVVTVPTNPSQVTHQARLFIKPICFHAWTTNKAVPPSVQPLIFW